MENASEALIMAFSVMVFVIALSVAISSFGQAKNTAERIIYTADETNFYYDKIEAKDADRNRIVGLETIIPTLYKYYKEDYSVVFKHASSYNKTTNKFSSDWNGANGYLTIYKTQTESQRLKKATYTNIMANKYGLNKNSYDFTRIFSFDLDEEMLRYEPWLGSDIRMKENIDCFLNGKIVHNYAYASTDTKYNYINYGQFWNNGFINANKNYKFIETLTTAKYKVTSSGSDQYNYSTAYDNQSNYSGLTTTTTQKKEKTKRMIIFTKVDNFVQN